MKLSVDEIRQICQKLGKETYSPDEVKKYLEQLKTGVVATEDVLRATGAGQRLNKLALYHKDDSVRDMARELRDKWKDGLRKTADRVAKPKPMTKTASNASSSAASIAFSRVAAVAGPSVAGGTPSRPAATRPTKERSVDTDKVKYNLTGMPTRDACIKLMYNGLAATSDEPTEAILKIAVNIEAAGYECFKSEMGKKYTPKMRSLFLNLKNKSHPELAQNVLSGKIAPSRFVNMTDEELKSEKTKSEDDRLRKENIDNAMVAQEKQTIASGIDCRKCKKQEVTFTQAQTRSADEPMTTFFYCTNCHLRWKMS